MPRSDSSASSRSSDALRRRHTNQARRRRLRRLGSLETTETILRRAAEYEQIERRAASAATNAAQTGSQHPLVTAAGSLRANTAQQANHPSSPSTLPGSESDGSIESIMPLDQEPDPSIPFTREGSAAESEAGDGNGQDDGDEGGEGGAGASQPSRLGTRRTLAGGSRGDGKKDS
jgi:hypothetical protein